MRKSLTIGVIGPILLMGCSQDFDEKYDDNLEALNKEADEIQSSIEKSLNERAEVDKALGKSDGTSADGRGPQN